MTKTIYCKVIRSVPLNKNAVVSRDIKGSIHTHFKIDETEFSKKGFSSAFNLTTYSNSFGNVKIITDDNSVGQKLNFQA